MWCDACRHRYRLPDLGDDPVFPPAVGRADGPSWLSVLVNAGRRLSAARKAAVVSRATAVRRGRLLDVGCADGLFLTAMAARGWTVLGVEPDSALRASSTRRGHRIEAGLADISGRFDADVLTMWHVLEHVARPSRLLEESVAHLAPGGHLVAAVPNAEARDLARFGERWVALDPRRHRSHFDEGHLLRLLEAARLEPVAVDSWPLDLLFNTVASRLRTAGTSSGRSCLAVLLGIVTALRLAMVPARDRDGRLRTSSLCVLTRLREAA